MMKRILRIYKLIKFKYRKTDNCYWLFSSYNGSYSDSPKIVSEYIHSNVPSININWLLHPNSFNQVPEYVNIININDCSSVNLAKKRAAVIIDNICGPYASFLKSKKLKDIIKFKIKKFLSCYKHQDIYSFWHGFPIKYGMNQAEDLKVYDMALGNLSFIVDSKKAETIFKIQFGNNIKFLKRSFLPRNYKICSKQKEKEIKTILNIDKEKKIVLYAPTYRGNNSSTSFDFQNSGINQIKAFNIKELIKTLDNKFGNNFILICRFHGLVQKRIIENQENLGDYLLGNQLDDMGDYLSICDVLITDYSSCMFDFMLTKKPVFLFCNDFSSYTKKRNLNIDITKLPPQLATTFDKLIQNINSFDHKKYSEQIDEMAREFDYIQSFDDFDAIKQILNKEGIK